MPNQSRAGLLRSVALLSLLSMPVANVEAQTRTLEVVAQFEQRPGNPSVTPDGRILLSMHPMDQPSMKVVEATGEGKIEPYPNAEMARGDNSEIKSVIGVRTDDRGVAWILDMGSQRLFAWDTKAEKLVRTITIPDDVLRPASFLQDFALDQKRGRVIIADMTQGDLSSSPEPAFVVVELESGKARRVAEKHPSMMPDTEGGFALNPITIDPDYEYVYFGALNGRSVYRVPAASFDGDSSRVGATIKRYGPKSFSDGISVDGSGNVYITDIEAHAIGVTTPEGYKILAKLPKGQSWPDGLSFGPDGYLYATVNQLDRSAALSGTETGTPPFVLVRLEPLAAGKVGR